MSISFVLSSSGNHLFYKEPQSANGGIDLHGIKCFLRFFSFNASERLGLSS